MEDIEKLSYLIYLPSHKIKSISYIEYYNHYYNLTLERKTNIHLWFEKLYQFFEHKQELLINIQSAADVLLYPINRYNINFIKTCNTINYKINRRKEAISISLTSYLPFDLIELIYKISIYIDY